LQSVSFTQSAQAVAGGAITTMIMVPTASATHKARGMVFIFSGLLPKVHAAARVLIRSKLPEARRASDNDNAGRCPRVLASTPMPNPSLSTRIDPSIVARVERCVEALRASVEDGEPAPDRGAVVRRLILRALPTLESELGLALTPVKRSTRTPKKRAAR
jgi:hypothetical protein